MTRSKSNSEPHYDVVIVGGGYIAVEFAGIFNGLGAQTTQLYRGPLFLRGFDTDIRAHAAQEIAKSGRTGIGVPHVAVCFHGNAIRRR